MPTSHAHEILSLSPLTGGQVTLGPGETVIVTGPNGVGKSGFISELVAPANVHIERFYGNRQINFSSSDTDHPGTPLDGLFTTLRSAVKRYYNPWSEQHLKAVIRRIIDLQAQASQDIVVAMRGGATLAEAELKHALPVDQVNECFKSAQLAVSFALQDGHLMASRDSSVYTLDKLSDGERAALLLVGAIVVQPKESFVLIDEPEKHLNPAICGPLIAAAVRKRSELGFLFSTHDLQLVAWLHPQKIIHIHNSRLVDVSTDQRVYDYAIIGPSEEIPEKLRYGLLGSRRALLLVEGTSTSDDRALYSSIYPGWNVIPREGWETVVSGVRALEQNKDYHWLEVAGIIDGDGRSGSEVDALARDKIYALPSPTIENIFVSRAIVEPMAQAASDLFGGPDAADRIKRVEAASWEMLQKHKEDIIQRRVLWTANRLLSESKVSLRDLRDGKEEIPAISLRKIYDAVTVEFEAAVAKASVFDVFESMPVKNTGIPKAVAEAAGFERFEKYTTAVLTQIERRTVAGQLMWDAVAKILPKLPKLD